MRNSICTPVLVSRNFVGRSSKLSWPLERCGTGVHDARTACPWHRHPGRRKLQCMFGWFSNSDCPADFAAKSWVEEQLEWLSGEFPDWLHEHPVIEPTQKFFPDEYDRSPRAVRRMLDR